MKPDHNPANVLTSGRVELTHLPPTRAFASWSRSVAELTCWESAQFRDLACGRCLSAPGLRPSGLLILCSLVLRGRRLLDARGDSVGAPVRIRAQPSGAAISGVNPASHGLVRTVVADGAA